MSLRQCDTSESVSIEEAFPGYGENPLGMVLKGARSREGLTQRQLAQMTGMPQRDISEMETGKRQSGRSGLKSWQELFMFPTTAFYSNVRITGAESNVISMRRTA